MIEELRMAATRCGGSVESDGDKGSAGPDGMGSYTQLRAVRSGLPVGDFISVEWCTVRVEVTEIQSKGREREGSLQRFRLTSFILCFVTQSKDSPFISISLRTADKYQVAPDTRSPRQKLVAGRNNGTNTVVHAFAGFTARHCTLNELSGTQDCIPSKVPACLRLGSAMVVGFLRHLAHQGIQYFAAPPAPAAPAIPATVVPGSEAWNITTYMHNTGSQPSSVPSGIYSFNFAEPKSAPSRDTESFETSPNSRSHTAPPPPEQL
ncbi:hypothetical protein C8F04DRAFT_1177136 [Mycena alexandri]|uniref:Uncharacterized protein n=1 Tax=Mycena alexandri TaxID=1745969 RepID=A0AAD6T9E0_9AGAR|nr:hypothetical protein C8F04DRAFT_1177136 [Mycena alexandri]